MKLIQKNKIQPSQPQSSTKKEPSTNTSSWEMSAQAALRVDYVSRNKTLPINHN